MGGDKIKSWIGTGLKVLLERGLHPEVKSWMRNSRSLNIVHQETG
jgi:hypothetical protein